MQSINKEIKAEQTRREMTDPDTLGRADSIEDAVEHLAIVTTHIFATRERIENAKGDIDAEKKRLLKLREQAEILRRRRDGFGARSAAGS